MKQPCRSKPGRPLKDRRRHLIIAATTDFRGPNEEQLFFLFRGASHRLLSDVFRFLIGNGNGIARQVVITEEHDTIKRNGKGYWRMAVKLCEPNYHFCSLDDMRILIDAAFHRHHPCSVHWLTIDKFLNV